MKMSKAFGISVLAVAYVLRAAAAQADGDITLQQGKHFSLYASGNCKRVGVPQVDLMLECQFQGKQARFYLKEFPGASMPQQNLANVDVNAECERMLRLALKGVDGDIGERIRLFGGTGTFGPTIYNYQGFTYPSIADAKNHPVEATQKIVLFRSHTSPGDRGPETAVLVVISDFDRANIKHHHGVPDEVITMLGSLSEARYRLPSP
jgi:hypothetical protein